jgi:hypothetical protein
MMVDMRELAGKELGTYTFFSCLVVSASGWLTSNTLHHVQQGEGCG